MSFETCSQTVLFNTSYVFLEYFEQGVKTEAVTLADVAVLVRIFIII